MRWKSLGDITLLIVDDDPFNRQLVVSLLDKITNIKFLEAENGIEALDCLDKHSVDMVLLDLHMPMMNGYKTLEKIKRTEKYDSIPVVIITTDEQEMNKLYALGANDFISKPFKLTELESRIYAHIEKRKYRQKYNELSSKRVLETIVDTQEESSNSGTTLLETVQETEKKKSYSLESIENEQQETFKIIGTLLNKENKQLSIKSVSLLSKALALLVGYNKEKADMLYHASMVRELGSVFLERPISFGYELSLKEKNIYEQQLRAGYRFLNKSIQTDFIKILKVIVIQRREHFDGSGFPQQAKERQIHNMVYIISLIESFNSLLSDKYYLNNKIHTAEETYAFLEAQSGQRFHPKITKIFLDHFDYFLQLRHKAIA